MHGSRHKLILRLLAAPLALVFAACPIQETATVEGGSEELRIEIQRSDQDILDARAKYRVSVIGLEVAKEEAGAPAEDKAGPGAGGMAEAVAVAAEESADLVEEDNEGDENSIQPTDLSDGPRSVQVMVDLVVRFLGPGEPLPGITVEVSQTDPYGTEKVRLPTWIETADFKRGEKRTVPVELEVDDYEEGDEFYVEFSEFVPLENRADYREFARSGG